MIDEIVIIVWLGVVVWSLHRAAVVVMDEWDRR